MPKLSLLALVLGGLVATASCGPPPPPEPVCFGVGIGAAPGGPPSNCKSEAEWRAQAARECSSGDGPGELTSFEVRQPCGENRYAGMEYTCCKLPDGPVRVDAGPRR